MAAISIQLLWDQKKKRPGMFECLCVTQKHSPLANKHISIAISCNNQRNNEISIAQCKRTKNQSELNAYKHIFYVEWMFWTTEHNQLTSNFICVALNATSPNRLWEQASGNRRWSNTHIVNKYNHIEQYATTFAVLNIKYIHEMDQQNIIFNTSTTSASCLYMENRTKNDGIVCHTVFLFILKDKTKDIET